MEQWSGELGQFFSCLTRDFVRAGRRDVGFERHCNAGNEFGWKSES